MSFRQAREGVTDQPTPPSLSEAQKSPVPTNLGASFYQTLQILSVTLFEKTPILCALQAPDADAEFTGNVNQLILFDI